MNKQVIRILDEFRAIAQLGLNYSKDIYDIERYNRMLAIITREYSDIVDIDEVELADRFSKELGYITPKVGVNGILMKDNKVLLENRADKTGWGVIGGWAEVGESPEESLQREFYEETGLTVEVGQVLHVFTQRPGDYGYPCSSYHILYACKYISGDLKRSHESIELEYKDYKTIDKWHRDHLHMVEKVLIELK